MAERFAKLKEGFFRLLPPTIYFFVTLHIVAIIRVLMVKGTGLPASSPATKSCSRKSCGRISSRSRFFCCC